LLKAGPCPLPTIKIRDTGGVAMRLLKERVFWGVLLVVVGVCLCFRPSGSSRVPG
jgi:hypothetical protein